MSSRPPVPRRSRSSTAQRRSTMERQDDVQRVSSPTDSAPRRRTDRRRISPDVQRKIPRRKVRLIEFFRVKDSPREETNRLFFVAQTLPRRHSGGRGNVSIDPFPDHTVVPRRWLVQCLHRMCEDFSPADRLR